MKSLATLSMVGLSCALVSFAQAQPVPESVYPPPEPYFADDPREMQTGFRFNLDVRYLTDYVWRGIERFDSGDSEDVTNLQFDTRIGFDLGKLPHPYVKLFVNVAENDPVSDFQEVRPEIGFDWPVRPLMISAGYVSYLFPDRDELESSEVFLKIALDDSRVFQTERPVFNPYVFGAYDFDQFDGLYVEAGINHTQPIEHTGLIFIINAHAAYVNGHDLFAVDPIETNSGFQHWQVGVTAKYTLNTLLNIPDRFGKMSVTGFINYTDSIDDDLIADDQLWGGAGFSLEF